MKPIGSAFPSEIEAAGLAGLPFSWGPDGVIEFGPAMTSQQRAAVLAVVAVHDAARVPTPSPEKARSAALEAMAKLPAYQPALDSLIAAAAKDIAVPAIAEAAEVLAP